MTIVFREKEKKKKKIPLYLAATTFVGPETPHHWPASEPRVITSMPSQYGMVTSSEEQPNRLSGPFCGHLMRLIQ
eukprot:scaffold10259_cov155-Amphora_coffeaeformis.AAC.8